MKDDAPQSPLSSGPVLPRLVRGKVALSWAVLAMEQLTAAFWPTVCWTGGLVAVALSRVLLYVPGWLHGVVVMAMAAVLGALVVTGFTRLRWPSLAQARDRLDASVGHRPLASLKDPLAPGGGSIAQALWQVHHQRLWAELGQLRVFWPRSVITAKDPWGLRILPVFALIFVLPLVHGDGWTRLQETFLIQWQRGALGSHQAVSLWVTPPSYTGAPSHHRTAGDAEGDPMAVSGPMTVPEGSRLVAVIHGAQKPMVAFGELNRRPDLFQGEGGQAGPASARLDMMLPATKDEQPLRILDDGREIARWMVTVTRDRAPSVALTGPIRTDDQSGMVFLPYQVGDDYGVTALTVELARPDQPLRVFPLALPPSQGGAEIQGTGILSLAADRWAGLPVSLRLTATDAAGAMAMTAAQSVRLPERQFNHPVAQKVAAVRRALIDAPAQQRAARIAELMSLSDAQEGYGGVLSVFMGLRIAATRLAHGPYPPGWPHVAPSDVVDLLWSVAVRIEDGHRGDAEQRVVDAQQALEKAIAEKAGAEEIARRIQELRRAVQEYMQTLMAQMPPLSDEDRQALEALSHQGREAGTMDPQSLDRLLDQLAAMEALGAHEAAEALRQQINAMVDALRQARPPDAKSLKALREQMQALSNLVQQQKQILEDTFQALKDDVEGRRQASPDLAKRQEKAGQALRAMGGGAVPPPLQKAGDAMDGAHRALGEERLYRATELQERALQALQQGAQQMMQHIIQAISQGQGGPMLLPGRNTGQGSSANDPLGSGPGAMGGDTTIPDQGATSRARDILLELRRRANDPQRTEGERDYIRRLLSIF